jgi:hypothetical protein
VHLIVNRAWIRGKRLRDHGQGGHANAQRPTQEADCALAELIRKLADTLSEIGTVVTKIFPERATQYENLRKRLDPFGH